VRLIPSGFLKGDWFGSPAVCLSKCETKLFVVFRFGLIIRPAFSDRYPNPGFAGQM
jgi:hypothetical protein